MGPAFSAVITVNTGWDSLTEVQGPGGPDHLCSLREAIANANADSVRFTDCGAGAGNDVLIFSGVSNIVVAGSFDILGPLAIAGPITLDGVVNGVDRIFLAADGNLSLNAVTFAEPPVVAPPGSGGAVPEPSALALTGLALAGLAASRAGRAPVRSARA